MKLKMVFGAVVSAGLAYGVLSLFGFYRGTMTPFQVATGVMLAAVYLGAFRAAVARKEAPAVADVQQVMTYEPPRGEEKEVFATAA